MTPQLAHIDVEVLCPCGVKVAIDATNGQAFHELPPCRDYIERELTDYVRFVRMFHERQGRAS